MNVTAVKNGFVSGASTAAKAIKNAALWAGRMIKTGFIKLADLIKLCWDKSLPHLKTAFAETKHFLRTNMGMMFVGLGVGGIFGLAAEGAKDKKWLARALRIGAAVSIFAAGVALGHGLTTGLTKVII